MNESDSEDRDPPRSGKFRRETWQCLCGEQFEFMSEIHDEHPPAVEFRCVKCSRVQLVRGRLVSIAWKDGDNWVTLTVT